MVIKDTFCQMRNSPDLDAALEINIDLSQTAKSANCVHQSLIILHIKFLISEDTTAKRAIKMLQEI